MTNLINKPKLLGRKELPCIGRLNIKFNISHLRDDLSSWAANEDWSALESEFKHLCENHQMLPPQFPIENKNSGYRQIALTEYDSNKEAKPSLIQDSFWDNRVIKDNPMADERFYNKQKPNLPNSFQEIIDFFSPHIHRTRLALLPAGHSIKPHIDYDTKYSIRVHIPIWSNSQSYICYANKDNGADKFHLPPDGSCYFLNPGLRHWAENNGDSDRIHLIMSISSQEPLKGMSEFK